MSKQRSVTLYSFNELSEEAQKRAIEQMTICNLFHSWKGYDGKCSRIIRMANEIGFENVNICINDKDGLHITMDDLNISPFESFMLVRKGWAPDSYVFKETLKLLLAILEEWNSTYKNNVKFREFTNLYKKEYVVTITKCFNRIIKSEFIHQIPRPEFLIENEYEFTDSGQLFLT